MGANSFIHQHRVSYAETAPSDHVYFSRYLEMIEECRGEFFRTIGLSLKDLYDSDGVQFPVRDCHIRYHGSARHDDLIQITATLGVIKRARITLFYEIHRDRELLISAEIEHACIEKEGKPTRFPADLLERMSPYQRSV